MAKAAFHTALNLLFFATVGTALLALTYNLTRDRIAYSEEQEKLKLIRQIVPASEYDNDIMKDFVTVAANDMLGNDHDTVAYRGRLQQAPSVAVLQATAPEGYGGNIRFVIAIRFDGTIGGVRVVSHQETPGLGDYIEIAKNDWINIFSGASMQSLKDADWKVKKDGGKFDYMAGATISPRAMVKGVHMAMQYFQRHRDELFAQMPAHQLNDKETIK
jgi:electron transport complex protein RnfG